MNTPLQTLKGFRDFLPAEKRRRNYVAQSIQQSFEIFGFEPLETPTLEYASLLLGKYGDEADKLVYSFTDRGDRQVALRYDQTVPSARVLAQYQNELPKYFRRYQIQNVFRADKPQKGRYREFTQADCDIFGAPEPLADAEILIAVYSTYAKLGLTDVVLEYNDRRLLQQVLSPFVTEVVSFQSITQSIDKLDKQSREEVSAELVAKGLPAELVTTLFEKLDAATPNSELSAIVDVATKLGLPNENLRFNPFLARGLDYYTGLIFEAKLADSGSSVGAGGRYDQLINQLSGVNIPAIGFAIGFDRTVDVMTERGLLDNTQLGTQVMITVFSQELSGESLKCAQKLRKAGIKCELYPAMDAIGKQLKVASQKNISYAVIIGEVELNQNLITLKNLKTFASKTFEIDEAIKIIKTN